MRILVLSLVLACPFTALLRPARCQAIAPAEQKSIIVFPPSGGRGLQVSALNIERGAEYPSVVYLKGNVEIKSPVCLPVGRKAALVCDGYMLLHADPAEFHEDTGQIEAHGNVSVIPLQHETARK